MPRRNVRTIYLCAGMIALAQSALAFALPHHPNGDVYLPPEVADPPNIGGIAYYSIFVLTGCITLTFMIALLTRTILRRGQTLLVRAALGQILIGALLVAAFVVTYAMNFVSPFERGVHDLHLMLFLFSVAFVLGGLLTGAAGPWIGSLRDRFVHRSAIRLIQPIWDVATRLQPEVRLDANDTSDASATMPKQTYPAHSDERLVRMVVETHDALKLIRGDADLGIEFPHPSPEHVRSAIAADAALLHYLCGDRAMPVFTPWHATLGHIIARMMPRDPLRDSLRDLYTIRRDYSRNNNHTDVRPVPQS